MAVPTTVVDFLLRFEEIPCVAPITARLRIDGCVLEEHRWALFVFFKCLERVPTKGHRPLAAPARLAIALGHRTGDLPTVSVLPFAVSQHDAPRQDETHKVGHPGRRAFDVGKAPEVAMNASGAVHIKLHESPAVSHVLSPVALGQEPARRLLGWDHAN